MKTYPSQKVQCCGQTTRSDCSTLVFMARSQNRVYCTLHMSYQTNKPATKQVCGETLDSGSEGSRVQVPATREQLNESSFPWSLAQMVRWPSGTEGTYWSQGLILVTCGHFSPLLSDRSKGLWAGCQTGLWAGCRGWGVFQVLRCALPITAAASVGQVESRLHFQKRQTRNRLQRRLI